MSTYESPFAQVRTASGLNILAGLWMVIAPWALGHAIVEAAMWNSVLVGLAIAILAIVRLALPLQYEGVSWTNFALGFWLVMAPFFLGFGGVVTAMWNHVIIGLIVLVLAAWSAVASRRGLGTDIHGPEAY
jgi:hypothetical protein